jgi:C1A family cysteine protease
MLAVLALLLGVVVANPYSALRYETAWKEEITFDWHNLDHKAAFDNWKSEFGKEYTGLEEEGHRFLVFLTNWKLINDHNIAGNTNFTMRLNQFGDMTSDEFRYYVHGHGESCLVNRPAYERVQMVESSPDVPAPAAVDWQAAGKVTPVKNQGQCGSCWAFSATGSTESQTAIKQGQTGNSIVSLSEQQLVDCSGSEGNNGCNGGLMDYAFNYMQKNGGLCSEAEYAYTARNGACKASTCGTKYSPITGHTDVTSDSYASLEAAVAAGPVSIAIEADQTAFQHYSSGVMSGTCGTSLDHGVLAVGYGTSGSDMYWKVKNSWGASWGMNGYILICKQCNKNRNSGECGILMEPSFPQV